MVEMVRNRDCAALLGTESLSESFVLLRLPALPAFVGFRDTAPLRSCEENGL